jgi:hypothetical protein
LLISSGLSLPCACISLSFPCNEGRKENMVICSELIVKQTRPEPYPRPHGASTPTSKTHRVSVTGAGACGADVPFCAFKAHSRSRTEYISFNSNNLAWRSYAITKGWWHCRKWRLLGKLPVSILCCRTAPMLFSQRAPRTYNGSLGEAAECNDSPPGSTL